jgi:hypothetical protein
VACLASRVPGEIVDPPRLWHVVVRPLNFTVRHQLVLLRIAGIMFIVLGAALAALGITGVIHGPSMAAFSSELAQSRGLAFDRSTWLVHWRVWGSAVVCVGAMVGLAGAALALQKRWGLLPLAMVLFLAATAPWVLEWVGLVRYRFERPGSVETLTLLAFALLATWGYFMRSEGRADA